MLIVAKKTQLTEDEFSCLGDAHGIDSFALSETEKSK